MDATDFGAMADLAVVAQFAAAASMLALAAWLFTLRFNSPINRAFGLFLILRALQIIAQRTAGLLDGSEAEIWAAFSRYPLLAQAPALAYFVSAYLAPRTRGAVHVARGAVLVAILAWSLYLWDHCLDYCRASGTGGPLVLLTTGVSLAMALAGLLLCIAATRTPGARGRAQAIVGMSLALNALLDGSFGAIAAFDIGWAAFAGLRPGFWGQVHAVLSVAAFPVAILALAAYGRTTTGPLRHAPAWVMAAGVVATGAWIVLGPQSSQAGLFWAGLWRMLIPALATYALVRHRLFGLDAKVRWTVHRGTLAALLVAVLFMVSESASAVFSDRWGLPLGILAAGTIVFALTPLQQATERFAERLVPAAALSKLDDEERRRLYEDQAVLVWADGVMGRKERALLDQLRQRLDIPFDVAARIEQRAAGLPAPTGKGKADRLDAAA